MAHLNCAYPPHLHEAILLRAEYAATTPTAAGNALLYAAVAAESVEHLRFLGFRDECGWWVGVVKYRFGPGGAWINWPALKPAAERLRKMRAESAGERDMSGLEKTLALRDDEIVVLMGEVKRARAERDAMEKSLAAADALASAHEAKGVREPAPILTHEERVKLAVMLAAYHSGTNDPLAWARKGWNLLEAVEAAGRERWEARS